MPRPRAQEPRDKQLLLRLTARQYEVLESVAHLERTTANAYAHQALVEHLAGVVRSPRVQADLKNRAAYDLELAPVRTLTGRMRQGQPTRGARGERGRESKRDS